MSYANDGKTIALYDLSAGGTNLTGNAAWNLSANGDGTYSVPLSITHFATFVTNYTIEREVTLPASGAGTILEVGAWGETEAVNIQCVIGWDESRRLFVGWEHDDGQDEQVLSSVELPAATPLRVAITKRGSSVEIVCNGTLLVRAENVPEPTGGSYTDGGFRITPSMTLSIGRRVSTSDPMIYAGGGWLRISDFRTADELRAEWLALYPSAEPSRDDEWFLVARVLVGSQAFYYGEIDRAEDIQIDGEILSVGSLKRAFHPDRKLQRGVSQIALRNTDKSKNRFFVDLAGSESITKAKVRFFAGRPGDGSSAWQALSADFYVERVDGVSASTVDLTLVSHVTETIGSIIAIPTLGELVDAVGSVAGAVLGRISDSRYDEQIPVTFGAGLSRGIPLQDGDPLFRTGASGNGVWRWLAGLSRKPWNEGEWKIHRVHPRTKMLERMLSYGVSTGSVVIGAITWHYAFFQILDLDRTAEEVARTTSTPERWKPIEAWIYENPGELWVQSPRGAEDSDAHDPATIIEEILSYYASAGSTIPVDAVSFAAAKRAYRGRSVGGSILAGQPIEEVIGKLCSGWNLDAAIRPDGSLMLRTGGVTMDDWATSIPAAAVLSDQFDVVENSYRFTVPQGNERWGVATRARLNGLPDYAHPNYRRDVRLRGGDGVLGDSRLGRRIVKDLDVSWVPLRADGRITPMFLTEHTEQHRIVTCSVRLESGVGLDLGDWVRLSHFAGLGSDGDTDRLFRVEGIEIAWSERQVRLTLLDMGEIDAMRLWVLDDEKNWLRYRDTGAATAEFIGAKVIKFVGYSPKPSGVQPGDIFWLNDGAGNSFASVISASNPGDITVQDDYGLVGTFTGCWEFQRSYAKPPTDITHPGEYVGLASANDLYGSLCDEMLQAADGALGAMTLGGDAGYEIYGE